MRFNDGAGTRIRTVDLLITSTNKYLYFYNKNNELSSGADKTPNGINDTITLLLSL